LYLVTTANDVLKLIRDNDVKFADFRFTDPRGKWQHVTFDIGIIERRPSRRG
jgi:glutamine synthetase